MKSTKEKTTVRHLFEYAVLRILELIVAIPPRLLALRIGAFVGQCLYSTGAYRTIVRKNMEHVGLWSEKEMAAITKRLYSTIGRYAVDFLLGRRNNPERRVHNYELLQPLLDKGKGVIVLLGHFGNWEILADMFGKRVGCLNVVAKPMHNTMVDRWLAEKRTGAKVETIYVDKALRRIYEVVKKNEILAILIDQYAGGGQGTPVPFLGKDAFTVRTVAGLAVKTGCGVLPTYALLRDDGSYDIEISVAPQPDTSGMTPDQTIAAYQKQHNDIISGWIRKHPEHWFGWFHKRYRHMISYK
jgi:KDO2-lipid IV(A) lauroyltransferase